MARPAAPLELPAPLFRAGQAVVGVLVGSGVDLGVLAALGTDWFVVVTAAQLIRVLVVLGSAPLLAAALRRFDR